MTKINTLKKNLIYFFFIFFFQPLGGPEMVPFEFRCPFGLVFDEQKLICEWPWKVPNCNGPNYGGEHGSYHFGGSYAGQDEIYPQGHDGQNFEGGEWISCQRKEILLILINENFFFFLSFKKVDYDGQNFNSDGSGVNYDALGQGNFNNNGGFDGQTFINPNVGAALGPNVQQTYHGQTYIPVDKPIYNSGSNYDGQTYNSGGPWYNGPSYPNVPGPVYNPNCNDQGYPQNNGGDVEKGVDVNNRFDNNNNKGVTDSSVDYDDQRGPTGTGVFNGQTALNAEGGSKTTQFSNTDATINNFAGETGIPTGFTANNQANLNGEPGSTVGLFTGGATNQFDDGQTTVFADNTARFDLSNGFTGQNTNFNAFTNTANGQTNNFNANTGLSTVGFTNNFDDQNGVGPTVYNSSYSASPGYPISTILPFKDRQSTIPESNNGGTTPFNCKCL